MSRSAHTWILVGATLGLVACSRAEPRAEPRREPAAPPSRSASFDAARSGSEEPGPVAVAGAQGTGVRLFRERFASLLAPTGVGVLTPEQAARTHHYRFEVEGGHLGTVRRVDELGRPAPDADGVAVDAYDWAAGASAPSAVRRLDPFGGLVERRTWDPRDGGFEERRFDRNGFALAPPVRVTLDARGRPVREEVVGVADGAPSLPPDWSSAVLDVAYGEGPGGALTVTTSFRPADGAPPLARAAGAGAATVREVREVRRADGGLEIVEHRDAAGRPTPDSFGVATYVYTLDAWGAPVEERRLDAAGRATLDSFGRGTIWFARDRGGREVLRTNHGPDGVLRADAAGVAQLRSTWDAAGRLVETAELDAAGALHPNGAGIALVRKTWDDRGLLLRRETFGTDGRRVAPHGVAVIEWHRDERGRLVELRVRNAEGVLAGDSDGIAIHRFRYDDRGNLIEQEHLDADERPTDALGPSIVRWTVDDAGRVVAERWESASPDGAADPVVGTVDTLDERGHVVRRDAFAADGRLVRSETLDEPPRRAAAAPDL